MGLGASEHLGQMSLVVDEDNRLIVVGPNGVPIAGGGGGGGVQYTEGDTDATITGMAIMWEDVGNALVATSVDKPLPVQVTSMPAGGAGLTDAELRASAVPVSGPLTDAQLRAAVVPTQDARLPAALDADGGVKAHIQNFPATQPVSLATNTPDVTDRAARELGRARLWDGTDEATILPVRTQPATTEKSLTIMEMPTRLATFQAVTAEVAPAITIGIKELFSLWSPAAVTQDVYIVEIVVSILVTTASTTGGRTNVEVFKITSAPTGGTNVAAADVGGGLGTSAVQSNAAANIMQVKTGGGALGTGFIRQGIEHATQPLGSTRYPLFTASTVGNGLVLRGGSSDGISIQVNRVVAHTALVDQWTASIRWIEL